MEKGPVRGELSQPVRQGVVKLKRTSLTTVVCILSAVWLAVALLVGWNAYHPSDCLIDSGTFSCLAANEWGDYLAGVFAPLAFFWLVAAVFIQSRELSEQREELRLTREEFAHNREVMKAQATEARNQAEFIGLQTKILEREERSRAVSSAVAEFDETVTELSELIAQRLTHVAILNGIDVNGRHREIQFRQLVGGDGVIPQFVDILRNGPPNAGVVAEINIEPSVRSELALVGKLAKHAINLAEGEYGQRRMAAVARLKLPSLSERLDELFAGNVSQIDGLAND
jgi:hypothetical protein